MNPEPLKGKIGKDDYYDDFFVPEDIKSALLWMIQIHEEKIELLVYWLENTSDTGGVWVERGKVIKEIETHYESIMIIEEGLSDVI